MASSTLVAVPAVLGGLALGVPLAVLLAKTDSPWRGGCRVAVVSLVLLPLPVFTTGWLAAMGDLGWLPRLFADGGPVRGWLIGYPGAIALHAIAATPWIALLGTAAVLAVDRRREEQALLDSPAGRVLWSVTLRDAAPALVAIGVVVAVLAATEMTITDLLRVRTFAEEVYTQAAAGQLTGDATDGSGMLRLACGVGVLSVIAAAAMMPLTRRLMSNEEAGDAETWHVRVTRYGLASWLLLGITALLTLIPLASLAYRAGVLIVPQEDGVQQTWSATKAVTAVASAPWQHRRELSVSITLAAAVATGAMLVGAAVAWAMRNSHTVRWLSITLAAIAMAIPGPVVGVFVIRLLNQPLDSPQALLGDLYGTWFAPWLAQMIRISPIALLLSWPGVAGVSHDVLNAARSDGAGFIARIVRVALPLCWPSLAATWLVAFAWSIGELSATVLVVPPGTPPLSVRLLSLLHYGVEDRVAAICLVLVIGYVFVALLASRLLGSTKRTQIEGD
ncbi:MAG: ABC transporter permease subunit [Planctomycetota bacterium]